MSSGAAFYASWFDVPDLADVLLNVYTNVEAQEPPTKRTRGETKIARSMTAASVPVARSYHCHGIILSGHSGCFKAQISSTWQQPTNSASTSSEAAAKRTVSVHIEEEELDAMHELLKMMYSHALPAAAAPGDPLFLQCLILADRFQAASCMELLLTALAAIPSKAIDHAVLRYVFQASAGVEIARLYPALLASSTRALLRLFGNVPKVINDEDLLRQFCCLPHAAVLAWVKSDELQVHSENCVVFLVSAWAKANQDSTAAQHEELAHQIRVFHLGPAYLHHILPDLSWFKDCSGMQHLPVVLSCIRAGIRMKQGLETEVSKISKRLGWPPAWTSKRRGGSSSSPKGSWILSASQLKELDKGTELFLSPPVYVNGFLLRPKVCQNSASKQSPERVPPAPPSGKAMGLFRGVDVPAMEKRGVRVPGNAMVSLGTVSFKVGSADSQASKEGEHRGHPAHLVMTSRGHQDFLHSRAPSFLELVAPYLQAGQLHIEATFIAATAMDSVAYASGSSFLQG